MYIYIYIDKHTHRNVHKQCTRACMHAYFTRAKVDFYTIKT